MHKKQMIHKWQLILLIAVFLMAGSAGVAFAEDVYKVPVKQNTHVDVQIMDANGHAVAPGREIDTVRYIVKSKPEGAKVSVYTVDSSELQRTGRFTMGFSCDMAGTVEIESFVMVKDAAKYYTGHHTVQVVAEESKEEKIVIMSIGSAQMIVNNDVVKMDAAPVIQDGRTYVPLRTLSHIFDAQCHYNAVDKEILITKEDMTICMTVGADCFTLNGTVIAMDAPAYISNNGRTMVPVRFIADAFGTVIKPTYNKNGTLADILLQL